MQVASEGPSEVWESTCSYVCIALGGELVLHRCESDDSASVMREVSVARIGVEPPLPLQSSSD